MQPPAPDRFRWVLVVVLRGGVLFAGALLAVGLLLYFAEGNALPLVTSPKAGHPVLGLASASAPFDPLVVLSFGLFTLIALPIARVALSLVHFARERDRLYVALTATVLTVLLVGIATGKAL